MTDTATDELAADFTVSDPLAACLDDLEARLDPDVEDALASDYRTFLEGHWEQAVFAPQRARPAPPRIEWPQVSVNAGLTDFNRMAIQQLHGCSHQLESAGGGALAVRANYGVCISSAWFGCDIKVMDEAHNTLPTSLPLASGRDAIDACLEAGVPDVTSGYGAQVYAMGRIFKDIMSGYPRIQKYVSIYHPDFQSPIDTCELVWGSDMFLAFYECPERVHRFLELITDTYIDAVEEWAAITPFQSDINAHWGFMHRGCIMLRTDSGMNLSPAMYEAFVYPYEERCLNACGGGAIHFCGRGDHFIKAMTQHPRLTGINMSQPELNDMETIYRHTVDVDIPLLGFPRGAAEAAIAAGRDLRGRVLSL